MSQKSIHGREKINAVAAVIIAINAMVGAGILAMPAVLARNVGPASIFSFLISIIVIACIGLTLGRASHHFPGEAWNYLYPSRWAGHFVGMLSAIGYVIGVVIAMGFLVQQVGIWIHTFVPLYSPRFLGLTLMAGLTTLVLAGARVSSWGQYMIGACVLTPLLGTGLVCWFHMKPELFSPFMPGGTISVFKALPSALFGFLGFESAASLYALVENPQKNVPRAFITAITVVGFLYLFFVCGMIFSIPSSEFSLGTDETLAAILNRNFPTLPFLSSLVLVGATFGIIGTLHSMVWSISALITDILTKSKSHVIHTLFRRDIWNDSLSVIVTSLSMICVSLLFSSEWLIPLTAVFLVPSYILSSISLLFVREEMQSGHRYSTFVAIAGGLLLLYYALEATVSLFSW